MNNVRYDQYMRKLVKIHEFIVTLISEEIKGKLEIAKNIIVQNVHKSIDVFCDTLIKAG